MVTDHYDESSMGLFHDDPKKPWTVMCECGYISWHKTEAAAVRALGKHRTDVVMFAKQVDEAENRVMMKTRELHRALDEFDKAQNFYDQLLANLPKKRKRNANHNT